MQLYPHQKKFLDENPDKALLAFETGTGKSLCALEWMKKRPDEYHLLICPKNIKQKWLDDCREHKINPLKLLILTKEEFKKGGYTAITSVIVDEADFFASPLFTKGRSQMAEQMYTLIDKSMIKHVLLLTATPYRNQPHSIHTLLSYIGLAPRWKEWQAKTYELKVLPYLPRPAWMPQKHWRKYAIAYATPRIYTAKMSDLFTVPEQHETQFTIPTEKLDPMDRVADTPVGEWHECAKRETDVEKLQFIKEYIRGKSKVIISCRYKDSLKMFAKELGKTYQVYVVTGEVKDQEAVIREAEADPECILLVQADIGAGWEAPSFSYMIFANLSFSYRSYVQMKGRILRANKLKENWYTHLVGGDCDKDVYKRIVEMREDFNI